MQIFKGEEPGCMLVNRVNKWTDSLVSSHTVYELLGACQPSQLNKYNVCKLWLVTENQQLVTNHIVASDCPASRTIKSNYKGHERGISQF